MPPAGIAHFHELGFVVLRGAFDPGPLSRELESALYDSKRGSFTAQVGGGAVIKGSYVPMMCEKTPVSLELLDRFEPIAAVLLGRPVLSARAKGVRYAASSPWHRDSTAMVASVGALSMQTLIPASAPRVASQRLTIEATKQNVGGTAGTSAAWSTTVHADGLVSKTIDRSSPIYGVSPPKGSSP